MAEVLHDDPLFQELGHLFQICNAFIKNKQTILEMKRMGCSSASKRLEGLVMLGIYFKKKGTAQIFLTTVEDRKQLCCTDISMKVILYMPLGEKDEYGGYQAKNKKKPSLN